MPRGFLAEGELPITRLAQSKAMYMNDIDIINARLAVDVATQDDDQIIFYMAISSTENGTYIFEEVSNNVNHFFSATGKWLKWKAILIGFAGNNTYFENVRIQI